MKKALLIGNRDCAGYMSIAAAEKALPEILGYALDTVCEDGFSSIAYEDIKDYDLIVFMPCDWKDRDNLDASVELFRYVLHGGNMLIVGNGLDVGDRQELKVISASVYKGSSYYTELDIEPTDLGKKLSGCDETVTVRDIPHFVKPDVFKTSDLLYSFRYGSVSYPALFAQKWSRGKVACMALDLTSESICALAPVLKAAAAYFNS